MTSYFQNKHIWITGASSGIGEGLARKLAEQSCRLSLSARREGLLQALASELSAGCLGAGAFALDVSDRAAVDRVHQALVEAHGPVDILIANAGISQNDTPISAMSSEAVDRLIAVNLSGAIHTIKAVLPSMIERGSGQIVGVSSLAGFRGLPNSAVYCATKAGFSSFLEGLRIELRSSGVAVSDICPGFIRTPMTADNQFPMPFLMELDPCVRIVLRAIRKRKAHLGFPWQLHNVLRLARNLPPFIFDRVLALSGRS